MKGTIIKIAALSLFGAVFATNAASAASVPISSPSTVKICKTVTNTYSNVTATFGYSFTATTSGVLQDLPTNQTIVFNDEAPDPSTNSVTKCSNISVTGISFVDETPRQVEVNVRETTTPAGYVADSSTYKLLFDIRNTTNSTTGVVTGQSATIGYIKNPSGTKVSQMDYTSARNYNDADITILKTVKGNAGDIDKAFQFTVNISGPTGTTYDVSYDSTQITGSASSCTANTNCTILLKHGETARIGYDGTNSQIPVGQTYTVTETAVSDYTTSYNINSGTDVSGITTGSQTVGLQNVVVFTNEKNIPPKTGIILNTLPYVALAGIAIAAIVYAKKSSVSKSR